MKQQEEESFCEAETSRKSTRRSKSSKSSEIGFNSSEHGSSNLNNKNNNNYDFNSDNNDNFEINANYFTKEAADDLFSNQQSKGSSKMKFNFQLYENDEAAAAADSESIADDDNYAKDENLNKEINSFDYEHAINNKNDSSGERSNLNTTTAKVTNDKAEPEEEYLSKNQQSLLLSNKKQAEAKPKFEKIKMNNTKAKTKSEAQSDSEPELIVERIEASELESLKNKQAQKKNRTINYEFMERYSKIIQNISVIFWSLSKNEKFKSLKNTREDYKYFFERMKEMTLKNLEFYNEREVTFILKAFRDLQIPLTKSQNTNFSQKIAALENFTLHDRIVLLGLFLKNDMGGSLELTLKFIENIKQSFNSLTYSDLIEFLELLNSVPNLINKFFTEKNKEKVGFIEKRFSPLLLTIEIEKFCKLLLIAAKFHVYFSHIFLKSLNQVLISRISG